MVSIQQMVHRNWLFLLAIILLLPIPVSAGSEVPSAEELFQELLESSRTVDFKGKITIMSDFPDGASVREALVIRKAPDKQLVRFTWPAEVRGMCMVSSGGRRWHVFNGESHGRRPPMPPPPNRMTGELPLRNLQLLLKSYHVRVLDGGHVAGRRTYLIEVEPKLTGRPAIKVWMDIEMGTILKIEQYDPQKRLKGMFTYSEINFSPDIDEAVFRERRGTGDAEKPLAREGRREVWNHNQGKLDLGKIRKEVGLRIILPDQAPAGFILQSIHAMKLRERENVHLTYTDGLAFLSVFQSQSDERTRGRGRGGGKGGFWRWLGRRGKRREDMLPRRGGEVERMNIDGTECEVMSRGPMFIFRWNHKGIYLTLMGELERKEMIEIVSSFVREGE